MKVLHCTMVLAAGLWWSAAFAHVDHDYQSAPEVALIVSLSVWQEHLRAFQRTGAGTELAAAEGISVRALQEPDYASEVLYLAAQTAQAGHRFADAHHLLDRLLDRNSHFDGARLMKAGIWQVQGNREMARRECRRLQRVSTLVLWGCFALSSTAPTRRDYAKLKKAVNTLGFGELPLQTRAWLCSVLGDLAVRAGDLSAGVVEYEAAWRLLPHARYQSTLVDLWLRLDRPERAAALLPAHPDSIGLQVKALVVEGRLGQLPKLASRITHLDTIFARDIQAGDYTHGREMAEYFLKVRDDPLKAKEILHRSLQIQREIEDEWLLREVEAALAEQQPADTGKIQPEARTQPLGEATARLDVL